VAEWCKIGPRLLLITYWSWYMSFQMRWNSSTLDDLESHRQPVQSAVLVTAGLFVLIWCCVGDVTGVDYVQHPASVSVHQFHHLSSSRLDGWCHCCCLRELLFFLLFPVFVFISNHLVTIKWCCFSRLKLYRLCDEGVLLRKMLKSHFYVV